MSELNQEDVPITDLYLLENHMYPAIIISITPRLT